VVIVHFLWILFLLVGWLPAYRYKKVRYFHLFGVFFALFLNLSRLHCPLTYLEMWLRRKAGAQAYDSSFIIYYLERLIYIRIEPELLRLLTHLFVLSMFFYYSVLFRKGRLL
jgi:hypothetical protein